MTDYHSRTDVTSFSNPQEALSTDIKLDWTLNFDRKVISGSAVHAVKVLKAGTDRVIFDSRNLHISSVSLEDGDNLEYTVEAENATLGNKLVVVIPEALRVEGTTLNVSIEYETDPTAVAAQWLDAEATQDKAYPFVFTQCQPIHARSLLPCQDAPGIKTTYSAIVRAPEWATVLMSALAVTAPPVTAAAAATTGKKNKKNKNKAPAASASADNKDPAGTFRWNQPVPVSAYLIALAAGKLASADISPRCRVWAEPSLIASVAYEFGEAELFLKAAEDITCPYQWTRYDILCPPPSFPFGGMENPCLTFATPTLLAGDRSLADVIAHEIAHSWTGNLVTNATWEHFWLNEGWTVWLERKIMSRVKGNEEVVKLSAQSGWVALTDSINQYGAEHKFTKLICRLDGDGDPDDAFSSVPYEKVSPYTMTE